MQAQRTDPLLSSDSKAMPKVNVPPSVMQPVNSILPDESHATPSPEPKKEGFVWDLKFSLSLIVLVIAVNTLLALLLGKSANLSDSSAMQLLADTEQRTIPLQKSSAAALSRIVPAAGTPTAGSEQGTRTYITPEEKRLLLKYLETPPGRPKPIEPTNP